MFGARRGTMDTSADGVEPLGQQADERAGGDGQLNPRIHVRCQAWYDGHECVRSHGLENPSGVVRWTRVRLLGIAAGVSG